MSWQATEWARKQRVGDASLKLLLMVLCNYANSDGQTWYTQEKISYDSEIPLRSLQRKMKELVDRGLIKTEQRRRPDGLLGSLLITILMPCANLADGDVSRPPKTGQPSAKNGGQPSANKVAEQDSSEIQQESTVMRDEYFPEENTPRPKKKRSTIPKIYPMTDRHKSYAAERGLVGDYARDVFDNFKNHHEAKGSVMADWDAAWRTWVGNEIKFNGRKLPPRGEPPGRGDDWG